MTNNDSTPEVRRPGTEKFSEVDQLIQPLDTGTNNS
jgi:hypothetical protein